MTSWRFVPLAMLATYAVVMSGIIVRYRGKYGRSPIRLSGTGGAMDRIREAALIAFGALLVWQGVAAAFGVYVPLGNRLFDPMPVLGTMVALAGALMILVAIAAMGASWEIPIGAERESPAAGLITSGPFRYSRNPIYLGFGITIVGWMMLIPTTLSLVIVIGGMLNLRYQALEEEKYLVRKYGADYEAWAREAGRFIPWLGRLPRSNRAGI
jgi:protein-S-isoprenylcysteine O-methyltransferase Ste14